MSDDTKPLSATITSSTDTRLGHLTVANAETNARLAPVPGQGGWVPRQWTPILVGAAAAGLTGLGDALLQPDLTPKSAISVVLKSLVAYFLGYFGVKSSGPRKE